MIKRTSCLDCKSCLIYNTENQSAFECFEYLSALSRGALTQPATDLTHYLSKSFAMLDLCEYIIRQSDLHERVAAEKVLKFNDLPQSFLCDNHLENIKFINHKFVMSFSIIPKNLSIAKCEEKLYHNSKKGKGSDDTHDLNKTLQLQYCLVLT